MPRKQRIFAVGAHPDDIELGCSGILRKHILNGDKVFFIVATLGERSGKAEERKKEAMKVAEMIGAEEIFFLNLPDTMVHYDGNTVSIFDDYFKKGFDIVYTHSPSDYHQDHASIAKSVLSASRNMKSSIFFYETPSTTIEFKPTFFVDISDVIDDKIRYIKQYSSQKDKEYMEEQAVIGLAKYRGYNIRTNYAEAFEVGRLRIMGW
jgi:LmbE family N-acetylglucosaminyl deacetylase